MIDLRGRTAQEVFDDHLRLSETSSWREDIERNVSPDIVVLTGFGTYRGRAGVEGLAALLDRQLPGARFTYTTRLVEGEVAYLEWTAEADGARVRHGADSFVIRDGWIVVQTIYYVVETDRA